MLSIHSQNTESFLILRTKTREIVEKTSCIGISVDYDVWEWSQEWIQEWSQVWSQDSTDSSEDDECSVAEEQEETSCSSNDEPSSKIARYENNQDQTRIEIEMANILAAFKAIEAHLSTSLHQLKSTEPKSTLIGDLLVLTRSYVNFISKVENMIDHCDLSFEDESLEIDLKDAQKCLAEIKTLLDKATSASLRRLLQTKICKLHAVCSLLGLDNKVAEYLLGLDDISNHQSLEYWIKLYLEERFEKIESNLPVYNALTYLGFIEERAKFIENILEKSTLSSHQSMLYWATKYLDDYFDNHILFNGLTKTRPGVTTEKGSTFEISTRGKPGKINTIFKVKGRNISMNHVENDEIISEYKAQNSSSIDEVKYWFHGTDQQSALNIVEKGIDLRKAKAASDFAFKEGFYVTPEFSFALEWPSLSRKRTKAIIVFKANKETLENAAESGKSFQNDDEKWKRAIQYFRGEQDDDVVEKLGMTEEEIDRMDNWQFIFGPLSVDGGALMNRPDWTPMARKKERGHFAVSTLH